MQLRLQLHALLLQRLFSLLHNLFAQFLLSQGILFGKLLANFAHFSCRALLCPPHLLLVLLYQPLYCGLELLHCAFSDFPDLVALPLLFANLLTGYPGLALLAEFTLVFLLGLFEQFLGLSLLLKVVPLGLVDQTLQLLLVADEKLDG